MWDSLVPQPVFPGDPDDAFAAWATGGSQQVDPNQSYGGEGQQAESTPSHQHAFPVVNNEDDGTDTDTSSDDGMEEVTGPDISQMSEEQAAEAIYMQYRQAKSDLVAEVIMQRQQQTLQLQHGIVKEISRLSGATTELNLKGWTLTGAARVLLLAGWISYRASLATGSAVHETVAIDLRDSSLTQSEAEQLEREVLAAHSRPSGGTADVPQPGRQDEKTQVCWGHQGSLGFFKLAHMGWLHSWRQ